jgi:transketolase
MADLEGVSFIRTTRAGKPTLYGADEEFPIGGSKVLRHSDDDDVTIVAGGITVYEALDAYNQLKDVGVSARVIDLYSVKPVDVETLRKALRASDGNLVVVEDHWPEGGLAAAVLEALAADGGTNVRLKHLAPSEIAGSATSAEQMAQAGIDAASIVAAARELAG